VQLIDTHAHLHAEQFDADRDAVIRRMRDAGVAGVVTIGTDLPASRAAIDLADQHADIWATVGVDPHAAASFGDSTLDELRELAGSPQVVAIGEIGLDYYWDKAPRQVQARVFERQLELARSLQLPVVIHNREAHADTLAMLRDWAGDHPWRGERPLGVLHCFSGDVEMAQAAIEIGFMISLGGPVTFKNAKSRWRWPKLCRWNGWSLRPMRRTSRRIRTADSATSRPTCRSRRSASQTSRACRSKQWQKQRWPIAGRCSQ